jgi:hypothetical protein
MGYRHLSLCCKCGQAPSRIDEVGLTDDHELVIHWWCEECKRVVYASKSLADCWQDCPRPDLQPAEPHLAKSTPKLQQAPVQSRYDDRFLKSLGISSE